MRALVAGAGTAGPLTALALHRVGIDTTVLERHPRPDPEVGSWLTLSPNGVAALDAVGLLPLARELGVPTRTNVMRSAAGRELGRLPLGRPLADGTPALTMKRSRLSAALVQACTDAGVSVRHGRAVVDIDTTPRGLVATLEGGDAEEADLLVAADGVRSTTRSWIDPAAPEARYVGLVNFGGITRAAADGLPKALREPMAWHFVFGRRAFFGHHVLPGGDVVWFVNEPRTLVSTGERAGTDEPEWRAHLASLFDDDTGPMAELVRHGELELAGDNTHDLGHVPRWHRDGVVLVGDAAHAPAPSSGQGASLALEDAVVLAHSLRDARDVPTAFTAYEQQRRRRVERIVAAGARSSSAKTPGPLGRMVRDAMLRLVFRYAVTERSTAWMYDHRVAPLDERPRVRD